MSALKQARVLTDSGQEPPLRKGSFPAVQFAPTRECLTRCWRH